MGFLLLFGRVKVHESTMYKKMGTKVVSKGNIMLFFKNKKLGLKYLQCILIGIPSWFVVGVIISFSDHFAKLFNIQGVTTGKAILFFYIGIIIGDITSAFLSNYFKSRKKSILFFYLCASITLFLFFFFEGGGSLKSMHIFFIFMGFSMGYTILNVTMSAEQFGTNLRATAAVSVPNMIRGSLPLMILLFNFLRTINGNYITGAWQTILILMVIGFWALLTIPETFNRDLDFVET